MNEITTHTQTLLPIITLLRKPFKIVKLVLIRLMATNAAGTETAKSR